MLRSIYSTSWQLWSSNIKELLFGKWCYWEHDQVKKVLGLTEGQIRQSKSLLEHGICGEKNKTKIRKAKYTPLRTKEMHGKEYLTVDWDVVKKLLDEVTPKSLLIRTWKIKIDGIR